MQDHLIPMLYLSHMNHKTVICVTKVGTSAYKMVCQLSHPLLQVSLKPGVHSNHNSYRQRVSQKTF